jgi:hypothetical protein
MTQLQEFLLNSYDIPPNTQTDGYIQMLDIHPSYSNGTDVVFRSHYYLYDNSAQRISNKRLNEELHLHVFMEKLVQRDLSTGLNICESFQDDSKASILLSQKFLKDSLEYFIKDWKTVYCLKQKKFPPEIWDKITEFSGLEDEFQNSKSQFYMNLIRAFVTKLSYLNFDHVKFSHLTNNLHYPISIQTIICDISEINSRVFSNNISDKDLYKGPITSSCTLVCNYLLLLRGMYNTTNRDVNSDLVLSPLKPYYEDEEISSFKEALLLRTTNLLDKIEECNQIVNSNPKDFLNFQNLLCVLNEKNMIKLNISHLSEQLQNFYKNTYKSAYYENLISINEFIEGFMEWFNSANNIQLRNNTAPSVNTEGNQQDNVIEQEGTEQSCQATSSSQLVTNAQTDNLDLGLLPSEELEVFPKYGDNKSENEVESQIEDLSKDDMEDQVPLYGQVEDLVDLNV